MCVRPAFGRLLHLGVRSLTIAAQRGASDAMKAANSSGVPILVIELKRAMAVSVSGLKSPAFTAPLSAR